MRGCTGLLRRKTSLSGFILCGWKDRFAEYEDTIMQYAAEIKIFRIEMKSSKNLQRSKHGLKTSTKFYLEERERENILQDSAFNSREGFFI